jgi:hypothetical protein
MQTQYVAKGWTLSSGGKIWAVLGFTVDDGEIMAPIILRNRRNEILAEKWSNLHCVGANSPAWAEALKNGGHDDASG